MNKPKGADEGSTAGAILYSIKDSFYKRNRIFEIDTSSSPAKITKAMRIMDSSGIFAGTLGESTMKDSLINADMTVNIDPEGIAVSQKGGFWLAHEGKSARFFLSIACIFIFEPVCRVLC